MQQKDTSPPNPPQSAEDALPTFDPDLPVLTITIGLDFQEIEIEYLQGRNLEEMTEILQLAFPEIDDEDDGDNGAS